MLKTTQSAEKLLLLIVEDVKVNNISVGGDCENKTVEKSPLTFKNLNRAISYLIPNAKQAFT